MTRLACAALALAAGLASAAAEGISESEYRRLRAPPLTLEARFSDGAVRLAWSPPRRAPGLAVSRYRIERRHGGAVRVIGETEAAVFIDRAPPRGRLAYVVMALSPSGAPVLRSAPARIAAP